MHYYQKFALIGFIISLFPIILGILALTTSAWISISQDRSLNRVNYDLFRRCKINETECTEIDSLQTSQYFVITGYIILAVGLLAGVLCTALIHKHRIHFITPIILIIGTVLILLGSIFYIKSVVENMEILSNMTIHLGYSMILMISTCIIGCTSIAYFSFTAGYIHRHILATVNIY